MGLYDRDYLREEEHPRGFSFGSGPQRSMVVNLIIINAIVFVIDLFSNQALARWLELDSDAFREPWKLYQVLTCAFAHANVQHIVFNMLGLWFFGQAIEARTGPKEFLRFYLMAAVVGSLAWLIRQQFEGRHAVMMGASGVVNAVVILFACWNPNAIIRVMLVFPMKAWVAAVLFVLLDMFAVDTGTAHEAHLGGALFGFLYYHFHWNFSRVGMPLWASRMLSRRPKLRVFEQPDPAEVDAKVDAILQKISEKGEASLTRAERKTLEEASRRYQRQRRS